MFLSLKATDRYTSDEVTALQDMFGKLPQLKSGLNRWIVVSRMRTESDVGFLEGLGLTDWAVPLDPEDVFYRD